MAETPMQRFIRTGEDLPDISAGENAPIAVKSAAEQQ